MTERLADPTGKRALFSSTDSDGPAEAGSPDTRVGAPKGKAALFSTPARRPGTVVVECSDCKVRSRVSLGGLAVRLATGSVWIPLGHNQHWMRCPACGRRRWCRIGWFE
jgi:hypothetical protein